MCDAFSNYDSITQPQQVGYLPKPRSRLLLPQVIVSTSGIVPPINVQKLNPTSHVNTLPTSHVNTLPTSHVNTLPTSHVNTSPTSHVNTLPTSYVNSLQTPHVKSTNHQSKKPLTPQINVSKPHVVCLLYTSPSPRDLSTSRMPSSA